jgi:hypothetical protein
MKYSAVAITLITLLCAAGAWRCYDDNIRTIKVDLVLPDGFRGVINVYRVSKAIERDARGRIVLRVSKDGMLEAPLNAELWDKWTRIESATYESGQSVPIDRNDLSPFSVALRGPDVSGGGLIFVVGTQAEESAASEK